MAAPILTAVGEPTGPIFSPATEAASVVRYGGDLHACQYGSPLRRLSGTTWANVTGSPTTAEYAALVDGDLALANYDGDFWLYDGTDFTTETAIPMPYVNILLVIAGTLYAFGGHDGAGDSEEVQIYSWNGTTWDLELTDVTGGEIVAVVPSGAGYFVEAGNYGATLVAAQGATSFYTWAGPGTNLALLGGTDLNSHYIGTAAGDLFAQAKRWTGTDWGTEAALVGDYRYHQYTGAGFFALEQGPTVSFWDGTALTLLDTLAAECRTFAIYTDGGSAYLLWTEGDPVAAYMQEYAITWADVGEAGITVGAEGASAIGFSGEVGEAGITVGALVVAPAVFVDFATVPTTTADPVSGWTYPTGSVTVPTDVASVRRSITDVCWTLTETVDGIAPIGLDVLRHAKVIKQDIHGTNRCIFYGVIPGMSYRLGWQENTTDIVGHDYGWYLSQQYVPSSDRIVPATRNPSDFVAEMLGYNLAWEQTTGVRPYRISSVTGWGTTLPAKEFVFSPKTTKWAAIQEMADYCNFVFYTKWLPVGNACTVDNPDPSKRLIRIEAEEYDAVEGTGYHDIDTANIGGAYRTAEGVDIEYFKTERGLSVGWIRDGEWLKYTRTFPWTGTYGLSFRVAAEDEATAAYFDVYLDDVLQFRINVGAQSTANGGYRTGSYQTFVNTDPDRVTATGVTVATAAQYIDVTKGSHVIKLVFGGNSQNVTPSTKHQNFARVDCVPAGATAEDENTLYQPVAYWVAYEDIDDPDNGLDLPSPVTISDPAQYPEDGSVTVTENVDEQYNQVTVRGHNEAGTYFEHTSTFVGDGPIREYFEESEKVVDAATAEAYANALLAFYRTDQLSYLMTLPQRFDLSLYQLIKFVGHAKLPTAYCRITEIEHRAAHADDATTITIIPDQDLSAHRRLQRMFMPSNRSNTENIINTTIAKQPQTVVVTCATVGTDTGTFTREDGGTMTMRITGV